MCTLTRKDFLPESIINSCNTSKETKESEETIYLDLALTAFLRHIRGNLSRKGKKGAFSDVIYSIETNATISSTKMKAMERLLLNVITNAFDVDSMVVTVECSICIYSNILTVEVSDDGPGMTSTQLKDFLPHLMRT